MRPSLPLLGPISFDGCYKAPENGHTAEQNFRSGWQGLVPLITRVFVPYTEVFIDILVASMKEGDGTFMPRIMNAATFGSTAEHALSGNMLTHLRYDMQRMGKPPVDLGSSEEEQDSAKCVIPVGWASSPPHLIDGLEARPTEA